MKSFLARVLGVRLDEVDAVVRAERPDVERVLSRRGFLAAAAVLAASPALPETSGVEVATWEQTITYSIPKEMHWHFIEALFQAYRLQIAVNRRFLVVDESLFDADNTKVVP